MALVGLSTFFVYFGIRVLISAYRHKDPFTFLMTFFAANFIILISATLLVCFLYRMWAGWRKTEHSDS